MFRLRIFLDLSVEAPKHKTPLPRYAPGKGAILLSFGSNFILFILSTPSQKLQVFLSNSS